MNNPLRVCRWLLLLLIAVSFSVVVCSGLQIRHIERVNAYIADPSAFNTMPEDDRAAFAHALWVENEQQHDVALEEWTHVLSSADTNLVAAAYYNRGNINLREALALYAVNAQYVPLVELAKQDYRNALALNSSLWDARYNLEIALRVVTEDPENMDDFDKNPVSSRYSAESKAFKVDLP